MNPTRKIQLFSLLCACLLWLAGCSQKPEPQPETPAPPVSPVQPEEPTPPENNGVAIRRTGAKRPGQNAAPLVPLHPSGAAGRGADDEYWKLLRQL